MDREATHTKREAPTGATRIHVFTRPCQHVPRAQLTVTNTHRHTLTPVGPLPCARLHDTVVCVCVCCRYPVCDTIINGQVHSSNLTHIAEVCNSTDGCEGCVRTLHSLAPRHARSNAAISTQHAPSCTCSVHSELLWHSAWPARAFGAIEQSQSTPDSTPRMADAMSSTRGANEQ